MNIETAKIMPCWKLLRTISTFTTPWLTLIGERVLDETGQELDYWRIEKDNSIIVIPMQEDSVVVPKPVYRHGISKKTIDFPGGRSFKNMSLQEACQNILKRELVIDSKDIISLDIINSKGWPVNSSFSNQLVYGYSAKLNGALAFEEENVEKVPVKEIDSLLDRIYCLQCRAMLLEWMWQQKLFKKIET